MHKSISPSRFEHELAAHVRHLVEQDAFSGVVLVARGDQALFSAACGLAERNFGVPVTRETRFNLGSMNKMFTAVAIGRLVARGDLSFDDTLDRFLSPDWLDPRWLAKIRIGHLLNHASGLGNYFDERFFATSRDRYRSIEDYRPLIAVERPTFEPGTKNLYSNSGFMLAGAVIEAATGRSYFDFVRENVYQPAGMHDTDCYHVDAVTPNLAVGYTRRVDDGQALWESNLFKHVIRGGPAGGGFSTAADLLRFDRALRDERLLPRAILETLWTPRPVDGLYGYGFRIRRAPLGRVVGHAGIFPGISTRLDMHLEAGVTAVVLSNVDHGAEDVSDKIDGLLPHLE